MALVVVLASSCSRGHDEVAVEAAGCRMLAIQDEKASGLRERALLNLRALDQALEGWYAASPDEQLDDATSRHHESWYAAIERAGTARAYCESARIVHEQLDYSGKRIRLSGRGFDAPKPKDKFDCSARRAWSPDGTKRKGIIDEYEREHEIMSGHGRKIVDRCLDLYQQD